jgi:hypothetical protein
MAHTNTALIIVGIIVLILGIGIKLLIGRRRFYRRNQSGLETFKNYKSALTITFLERASTFIGGLLIIFGLFCLIVGVLAGK